MMMGYTGPPTEWLEKVIANLKFHLTELGYRESTILRLDATWKELIAYCETHKATEFTVNLSGSGMVLILETGMYLKMSAGPFICWMIICSMEWSLSNRVSP